MSALKFLGIQLYSMLWFHQLNAVNEIVHHLDLYSENMSPCSNNPQHLSCLPHLLKYQSSGHTGKDYKSYLFTYKGLGKRNHATPNFSCCSQDLVAIFIHHMNFIFPNRRGYGVYYMTNGSSGRPNMKLIDLKLPVSNQALTKCRRWKGKRLL